MRPADTRPELAAAAHVFGCGSAAPGSLRARGVAARRAPRHVLMTADAVGGVWQYAVDLGRALRELGTRTTLVVMGPEPGDRQRREAESAGLTVLARPYRLEWMEEPWTDLERAADWLLALESSIRPDVVHLNGYVHAALPWTAPVLVVAHSCVGTWWRAVKGEAAPARLAAYREAVAAGLRAARLVVAPSAAMLDALRAEYGVPVHGRVVPNGCADPFGRAAMARKEPFVLAAGRAWDDAKNIRAVCEIAGRLPWPVCVAGEAAPPGGSACELPGVRALGPLPRAVLADWYRRAAIYALPARYEPFGLSVLEAARAGCALVLGDIPCLRENWSGCAIFVPPDDRGALARALHALVADTDGRAALGERAAARAAGFPIGRTVDGYLQAYGELLA